MQNRQPAADPQASVDRPAGRSPRRSTPARRQPAVSVDVVVRAIEEDIIFGHLKPRERLVEDTLMERHGAKRHVVRQALAELVRQGIVVHEPNKGCAVREFATDEVEALYDMRALLQAHAARLVPLPAPAGLVDELRRLHKAHSAAVEAGDLRAVYRLNNAFHDTLFAACGNPYLIRAIGDHAWLAHAIRSYRIGDPALLAQAREEHGEMIAALETGDRERLVALCVAHILPSKEVYLATMRLVDRSARAPRAPTPDTTSSHG